MRSTCFDSTLQTSGFQGAIVIFIRGGYTKFNCMLWIAGLRNEPVDYCEGQSGGRWCFEDRLGGEEIYVRQCSPSPWRWTLWPSTGDWLTSCRSVISVLV
jgi:hypothetical protein